MNLAAVCAPLSAFVISASVCGGASAHDLIGIHLRPTTATVAVGDVIDVDIMMVREPAGGSSFVGYGEATRGMDLYFGWNPDDLQLLGTANHAAGFHASGLPAPSSDMTGFNETVPPQDGTGWYSASAFTSVVVSTQGTRASSLVFRVKREFTSTQVIAIPSAPRIGQPGFQFSRVMDAAEPGYESTGTLVAAVISQGTTSTCAPDLNRDGVVDSPDLTILLAAWGIVNSPANIVTSADSPTVDGVDLGVLLAAWGPCGN
jgi:hypothetical protein